MINTGIQEWWYETIYQEKHVLSISDWVVTKNFDLGSWFTLNFGLFFPDFSRARDDKLVQIHLLSMDVKITDFK